MCRGREDRVWEQVPAEARDIRSHGDGTAHVGSRNPAWVFSKSSRSSPLLGDISRPLFAWLMYFLVLFLRQGPILEPRFFLLQAPGVLGLNTYAITLRSDNFLLTTWKWEVVGINFMLSYKSLLQGRFLAVSFPNPGRDECNDRLGGGHPLLTLGPAQP